MQPEEVISSEIESPFEYLVFSRADGVLSRHSSATHAVAALVKVLREHPQADAAIYRRTRDRWTLF